MPVEGGQSTKVLEDLSDYLHLAIMDRGLYFVPASNAAGSIQFLNFAANQIRPVASFEKPLYLGAAGGLAVSPDGRWILYAQIEQAGSKLMLVGNFH
jgi:hypothetical protein